MSHYVNVDKKHISGYKIIKYGSDSVQTISSYGNDWDDLYGGQLEFSPQNADFVIFEYNFWAHTSLDSYPNNDELSLELRLVYSEDEGSSWTDFAGNPSSNIAVDNHVYFGQDDRFKQGNVKHAKFCIPGWGYNKRLLKVQGQKSGTSMGDAVLHRITTFINFGGTTESNLNFYRPTASCYGIFQ